MLPSQKPGRPRQALGCSGANCKNNRGLNPQLSFFRFPKDRDRCLKWIENCRRTDLLSKEIDMVCRNYVLCADHFERSQFMNCNRNKLIWSSIPTLFEVPNPPLSVEQEKARGYPGFVHCSAVSDDTVEDFYEVPRVPYKVLESFAAIKTVQQTANVCSNGVKRLSSVILTDKQLKEKRMRQTINRQRLQLWRLRKQVKQLRTNSKIVDKVEELIKSASNYLSGMALTFFAHQLRMASNRTHGQRWSRQERLFALALNHISPDAYRLCSQVFGLPSPRTLLRWLKHLRSNPDFSESYFGSYAENIMDQLKPPDEQLPVEENQHCSTTTTMPIVASSTGGDIKDLSTVAFDSANSSMSYLTDDLVHSAVVAPPDVVVRNHPVDVSSVVPHVTHASRPLRNDLPMDVVHDSPVFEQQLDVFAPLSPSDADFAVANHEHIQIQFDSDQLDSQTLQLIADLGSVTPFGESATITAMREVSPEGTVTLTPITSGCPFTVSDNTVKLEIVTLGLS